MLLKYIWLYAGKTGVSSATVILLKQGIVIPCLMNNHSDKASRAENQQERLISIGWVVGFVDGEGCFTIHLIKQPDRPDRKGYRTGFQVGHEFVVVQGAKSLKSLKQLKKFFGVGTICINRRHDNHKEDLYRYSVTKRDHLLNVIIPFFLKYQLHTEKQKDFRIFIQCLRLIKKGRHLTFNGLIEIVQRMEKMNHKKKRTELIRILRNQTPKSVKLQIR